MADVNQNKLLLRTLPQCAVQPHHAGLPKIQTAHCAGLRPLARPAAALQTKYSTAPTRRQRVTTAKLRKLTKKIIANCKTEFCYTFLNNLTVTNLQTNEGK